MPALVSRRLMLNYVLELFLYLATNQEQGVISLVTEKAEQNSTSMIPTVLEVNSTPTLQPQQKEEQEKPVDAKKDQDLRGVLIRKVPDELNDISKLGSYFSK